MAASRNTLLLHAFGKRLRKLRARRFVSAQQMAYAIGVEPHTYRHWERGQTLPNLDMIERICRSLDITPNDLLPEAAQTKNKPTPPEAA